MNTNNKTNNNNKDKDKNIEKMLSDIMSEKIKLENITKKVIHNKNNNTMKNNKSNTATKNTKNTKNSNSSNNKNTQLIAMKADIEQEHSIGGLINIKSSDFKNVSKDTVKKILELLKNYVNMDKSFRIKHESLKTLYQAYLDLYQKYKDEHKTSSDSSSSSGKSDGSLSDPKKHDEMLKSIHGEMKNNNTNLYRERLMILKKIKESPEIEQHMKDNICGKLLILFKSPPVSEYKQFPMLENKSLDTQPIPQPTIIQEPLPTPAPTPIPTPTTNNDEKIDVKELDEAYLQKHNELMTVYKAYQSLYNKVLNYKDELEKYKKLPTGSTISRSHMDKLLKDQSFVMDMIDKMQDQLVSKNIISNSEKVPINPVTSHPENMGSFNNTMRDQIKHIIDRNVDIKPSMKSNIDNLLGQYKDCDSNDKFCQSGRQLLLIKKP